LSTLHCCCLEQSDLYAALSLALLSEFDWDFIDSWAVPCVAVWYIQSTMDWILLWYIVYFVSWGLCESWDCSHGVVLEREFLLAPIHPHMVTSPVLQLVSKLFKDFLTLIVWNPRRRYGTRCWQTFILRWDELPILEDLHVSISLKYWVSRLGDLSQCCVWCCECSDHSYSDDFPWFEQESMKCFILVSLARWVWVSCIFGYDSWDLIQPREIPWGQWSCKDQTIWDVPTRVREFGSVGWRDDQHHVLSVLVHREQDVCQQGIASLWWSWESAKVARCSGSEGLVGESLGDHRVAQLRDS
jgi:hypothetical protein